MSAWRREMSMLPHARQGNDNVKGVTAAPGPRAFLVHASCKACFERRMSHCDGALNVIHVIPLRCRCCRRELRHRDCTAAA